MASQDFLDVSLEEWIRSDAEITALLSELIDDAQIDHEFADIPPEILLPYDGPLLGDHHYCDECENKYKYGSGLVKHKRTKHKKYGCSNCGQQFTRPEDLSYHNECCQGAGSKRPHDYIDEQQTPKKHKRNQVGGGEEDTSENETVAVESAIEENLKVYKMTPNKNEKYDLSLTLQRKRRSVINNLQKELKKKRGIKWFLCVQVKMVKHSPLINWNNNMKQWKKYRKAFSSSNEKVVVGRWMKSYI